MARHKRRGYASFDELERRRGELNRDDLEGLRVGLEYTDSDGVRTRRAVRIIRYYDDRAPRLYCFCDLRRSERSFLIERIDAVVDGDGIVEGAGEFLSRFGIHPAVAPRLVVPAEPREGVPTTPSPRLLAYVAASNARQGIGSDAAAKTVREAERQGCIFGLLLIVGVGVLAWSLIF